MNRCSVLTFAAALLMAARLSGQNPPPPVPAVPPPRPPNELGRIPILEYHLVTDHESRWSRERGRFRRDLEMLYERGYRPVTMSEVIDRRIDLAAGLSPVVFTFDDASPSQFRFIERGDSLLIDSTSALGIWLAFGRTHPDWRNRAVFCMLPAASAGHAFFGDHGIEGQRTEWRLRKVRMLHELGFELCGHTLWHADLEKYTDAVVQEQIARGNMAIDSAVPGYQVRTFALPLGVWPVHRELARSGSWRDAGGRTTHYHFDAILEVTGGPVLSPYDRRFDPLHLSRIQATGSELEHALERLDRPGERYVSDGNPETVARPR